MRLDKCLTENLGVSRKEAVKILKQGLVTVNNVVEKNGSLKLKVTDKLLIDGQELTIEQEDYKVYYMLNKPKGYVSASDDSLNPYVISLFSEEYKCRELFCVGRLDLDTTGLLFVTNDGNWCHKITSPKHHVKKVYKAILRDDCEEEAIAIFKEGVLLNGEKEKTKPAKLTIVTPREVLLEITEGKYHQVKRMFASIGNKVLELERLSIGDVELDDNLARGEFRKLTIDEMKKLGVN
jgi:16S rRNA pseudouridine516 synthase